MTHRTYMFTGFAVLLAGCNFSSEPAGRGDRESPPAQQTVPPSTQPPPPGQLYVRLSAAALSPDGTQALTGYDRGGHLGKTDPPDSEETRAVKLWSLKGDGELLRSLGAHDDDVCMVGFLPDGKRAVSAGGKQIKGWDLETGKETWSVDAYTIGVQLAAVSPDGKYVLTAGADAADRADQAVFRTKLWDAVRGKLVRGYEDYDGRRVQRLYVSPDSKLAFIQLVHMSDMPAPPAPFYILDVETGKTTYKEKDGKLFPAAVSPDSRLAVSDRWNVDRKVKPRLVLWDIEDGKEIRTFQERRGGAKKPTPKPTGPRSCPMAKKSCPVTGMALSACGTWAWARSSAPTFPRKRLATFLGSRWTARKC